MHRLGLADAVRARNGLEVDLRVVVALEHDDGRRRREVDAEAAGARRDEEDLECRFLALEEADVEGATRARRLAVEAGVCRCEEWGPGQLDVLIPHLEPGAGKRGRGRTLVRAQGHVVLEDVEHAGERAEDEDALALGQDVAEDLVERDELRRGADDVLVDRELSVGLRVGQQVRVRAAAGRE